MASASQPKWTYEVFLSFRGPDVRHNILSHLYAALKRRGIHAFIDSEELQKGERISLTLRDAIKKSRIAVIIFSENFAYSHWCLDELDHIIRCKETNKLIVLPVFYKVEPREVRSGRESYKKAIDGHGKKCKDGAGAKPAHFNSVDVENWRKALEDAGDLSGWEYNVGSEADLVERIAREIWVRLNPTPLPVAVYPVGIDSQVNKVIKKLNMESRDEVLRIGLLAMGGMGKTTIAQALYNKFFKDFEASAFVGGIKETSQETEKMVCLQKNLLSSMLMTTQCSFTTDAQGSSIIAERLRYKRVLLILDGVDDICQINCLARELNWFGEGSRIIITTRCEDLLNNIGACIHEVQPLDIPEARELFKKHAFRNRNRKIEEVHVDRAVQYTQRLPLALEVLGSAFGAVKQGANEQSQWESILNNFHEIGHPSIDRVLRVSHNQLDTIQQKIFLHIACFFNGWSRRYVEGVLKNCGLPVDTGVNDLIRRSLIRDENGTLKVHDLIELMGKKIVKEENDDVAKRSRLWLPEDVISVLRRKEGTDAVKAIVLALPNREVKTIPCEAFAKLQKLEILIMVNVETDSQGAICLPNELRWFEWPECRASSLTFDCSNNPAVLAIRKCIFNQPGKP